MHFKTRRAGDFYSASSYRQEARAQLEGHWKEVAMLSIVLALFVIFSNVGFVHTTYKMYQLGGLDYNMMVDSWDTSWTETIVARGTSILFALISTSITFAMLQFVRKIKTHFDWTTDLILIVRLPIFWKLVGLEVVKIILVSLWTVLFIIPGIIKSYSYSQASFIMYDDYLENGFSNLSIMECITASRDMMRGHKGRKFMLDLSFIGWQILANLTLGLGMIFLKPYLLMTDTIFYENLRLQSGHLSNRMLHEMYQKEQAATEDIIGEDPDDFSDF
ncbi:DUF975 family protein [Allofustis seminis]|uniref:DUF975 family protein n=1 Tax=Allofustis seminis TaxID=166939 RepID=UPI0003686DCF|nr:DUF975 family protein [Allofustis seminis]